MDFRGGLRLTLILQADVDFGYRKPWLKDAVADLSALGIVGGENPGLFAVIVAGRKNSAHGGLGTIRRENHAWRPIGSPRPFPDGAKERKNLLGRSVEMNDKAAFGMQARGFLGPELTGSQRDGTKQQQREKPGSFCGRHHALLATVSDYTISYYIAQAGEGRWKETVKFPA